MPIRVCRRGWTTGQRVGEAGDALGRVENMGVCLCVDRHTHGLRPPESGLWGQVRSHKTL